MRYTGYPVVARSGEAQVLDLYERDADPDLYVLTGLECADGIEFRPAHLMDMIAALSGLAVELEVASDA